MVKLVLLNFIAKQSNPAMKTLKITDYFLI